MRMSKLQAVPGASAYSPPLELDGSEGAQSKGAESAKTAPKAAGKPAPQKGPKTENTVSQFQGEAPKFRALESDVGKLFTLGADFSPEQLRLMGDKLFPAKTGVQEKPLKKASTGDIVKAEAALPELATSAKGANVQLLQRALKEAQISMPGGADGAFGPKTEAAVKAFQKAHDLKETGVVDADTWSALKASSPKAFAQPAGKVYEIRNAKDGTPMMVQSDARWGSRILGNAEKVTIGRSGCALTCLAMDLSKKLGRQVLPDELNDVLVKNKGCFAEQGANLMFAEAFRVIEKEYGVNLGTGERHKVVQASKNEKGEEMKPGEIIAKAADEALKNGQTLMVDIDTNLKDGPNHFGRISRKDGEFYVVIDPSYGNEHKYRLVDGQLTAADAYYQNSKELGGLKQAPTISGFTL